MTDQEKLDLFCEIETMIAQGDGEIRLVCNALRERIEALEKREAERVMGAVDGIDGTFQVVIPEDYFSEWNA